ncbi:hypothetical protein [Pontibacterium sp.]|uniref:hypothetical protein n=1 Tax=Pontibacterium sp. TaxID=2036026 RepID=UPI0035632281
MKLDSAGLQNAITNQLSSLRTQSQPTDDTSKTQMRSGNAQPDKVSLSNAGASHVANEYIAFEGDVHVLIVERSERADRMESVLDRLSDAQQNTLIDTDLIQNEDFLALAEELSDEELSQLTNAVEGLRTTPQQSGFTAVLSAGKNTDNLISTLTDLNAETRSRVLDEVDRHAAKIPLRDTSETYQPNGQISQTQGASSADDLHNFVQTVSNMEDVGKTLDTLANFSDGQQSGLLHVFGKDTELGGRLAEQLSDRSATTKDTTLNYLGGLAAKADPSLSSMTQKAGSSGEDYYAIPEHDNLSSDTLLGMIESSVGILENYDLSDEQVTQMSTQLNVMDVSDQRAYITITETSLDQLIGADSQHPEDMEANAEVMDTVDALRSDATVRDAVFMSRMGDQRDTGADEDHRFYEVKQPGTGERDQETLIKVLATDAWVNRKNEDVDLSTRAMHLADNLDELGADARDQRVHDLNRLIQQQVPLVELSDDYLQQDTQDFQARTNALAATQDMEALRDAELSVIPEQRETFWQAAGMAGEEVDQLVDLLNKTPADMGEKMMNFLAEEAEQIRNGEKTEEQGRESVHELINFFESHLETDDRKRYLEGL